MTKLKKPANLIFLYLQSGPKRRVLEWGALDGTHQTMPNYKLKALNGNVHRVAQNITLSSRYVLDVNSTEHMRKTMVVS